MLICFSKERVVTNEGIDELKERDDDISAASESGVHDALVRIGARYLTALVQKDQRIVGDDAHNDQEDESHQNAGLLHCVGHSCTIESLAKRCERCASAACTGVFFFFFLIDFYCWRTDDTATHDRVNEVERG